MSSSKSYDWTQFKQRILVKVEREQVFRAWTDETEIVKWFPEKAVIEPRKGGRLYFEWVGGDKLETTILEVRKPSRVVFPFGGKTVEVAINLSKVKAGTVVELHQYHMKTDPKTRVNMHMGCKEGWAFFLANLKSYLEHGIDLRGHDPKRCYVQGYVNS